MRKLLALIPGLLVFSLVTTQVFGQAALLPNAKQTFLGTTGAPLASGSVTFYVPGTTNKKTTWQDSTQTTNNQNPVPLDAAGRAVIYGQGNYRQVVKDANGNTIWDALTTAYGASAPSGGNDTAPVGSIMQWSGFSTPTNWAWANGQAISRTTYPDLLTAITIAGTTISCTASSATLGGWADTSQIRVGAPIEASCIPTGTTVVSIVNGSTITVSNNATATITTTAKVFPWGNGDGVSTFNVPDLRGRVVAGADTMQAGSSAGRLTVNTTIATSSGSSTLTPTTLNGIYVGMSLVSANIPAGTTVSSIGTSTIVASNNATATATGTTAKFAAFVSADVPGATGGSQSHTQIGAEVGAHNHTITDPGHTHVPVDGNPDIIGAPNTGSQFATAGGTRGSLTTLLTATTNILINNSPTAVPAPIVQPTITSNYIIKVKGNITGAGGVISIGGLFGDIAVDATMQAYTSGTPSVNYIGIANATTGTMLANVSGSTVQPTPTTNSQWLDNTCGSTQGMISYRGASTWDCLTPGTSGFALVTNGAGANPSWTPVGANASTALKVPVDLATTGSNITLSGEQTIDGVLTSSSRVLVKDQSIASQNGIYTTASGAWTRATDWNATGQVVQGTQVKVSQGAVNQGVIFWVITANPITIGTTAVTMSGEIDVVASSTEGYAHAPVNFILNEDFGSFGSTNTHNGLAVVGGKNVATSNTTGSWNLHTDSYYGAGGTAPDFFVASQSIMHPFYNWSGGVPAFNIRGRFFARGDNINIPAGMLAAEATGQEIDITTAGSVTADRHGVRIIDLASTGAHALYESGLSILSSGIGFNTGIYLGDQATSSLFPVPAGGTILKTAPSTNALAAGIDFSNLTGAFPGFIFGSGNGDIRFQNSSFDGGRIISRTTTNGMIIVFGDNVTAFKDHADAFAPFEFDNLGTGAGKLYVGNGSGGTGAGTLQLGSSGFLGSIIMGNAASGLLTLQPTTGALGAVTVSIPAATDTLVNLASSQALINKSYNGLTLTSTTGTFTLAAAKTLTVNNTLTFSGTDGSTLNVGGGGTLGTAAYQNTGTSGATLPFLNGTNTWSGVQTFGANDLSAANVIVTGSTVPTNGMYLPSANTVGFAVNGTGIASFSNSAWNIAVNPGAGQAYNLTLNNGSAGGFAGIELDPRSGGGAVNGWLISARTDSTIQFYSNTAVGGSYTLQATLDTSGKLNIAGVFSSGGTAGLSKTYNVRAAGGAGDCTIIVTGGIATGGTC